MIARQVCKTDRVCGNISSETKGTFTLLFFDLWIRHQIIKPLLLRRNKSVNQLKHSIPVNSITMVGNLKWLLISLGNFTWYGV
jgi:hypothetical protein